MGEISYSHGYWEHGRCYFQAINEKRFVEYYTRANVHLGNTYMLAQGVDQDTRRALSYFQNANLDVVNQWNVKALVPAARILFSLGGIEWQKQNFQQFHQNRNKGKEYLRKAIAQEFDKEIKAEATALLAAQSQ